MTETDPRVGGRYLWGMRSPDGQEIFTAGVFREVVEPERIVVTESFADADGTDFPASHYGMAGDWPPAVIMTVTLEERDSGTLLAVREEGIPKEMRGRARKVCGSGSRSSPSTLGPSDRGRYRQESVRAARTPVPTGDAWNHDGDPATLKQPGGA